MEFPNPNHLSLIGRGFERKRKKERRTGGSLCCRDRQGREKEKLAKFGEDQIARYRVQTTYSGPARSTRGDLIPVEGIS